MAKKTSKRSVVELPLETIITVVASKGTERILKDMRYGEALELLKKKSSYSYSFYQKGFCMVKPSK